MLEEQTNKMKEWINVNSGMNVTYSVHIDVLKKAICEQKHANINILDDFQISIDNNKNNVSFKIKYKVKKNADFVFETKNLIFFVEQKTFSLINVKPINVNLEYCGTY
ncbi:MMB_0454 family protein [Mycoplasma sp. 3341]|uniref:MMB_0454 family protein n=1 Tax=Mycoplasma sp. 3341 TaxID=3447506 RepID=UPI003F65F506